MFEEPEPDHGPARDPRQELGQPGEPGVRPEPGEPGDRPEPGDQPGKPGERPTPSEPSEPAAPLAESRPFGPVAEAADALAFDTLAVHAGQEPDPATGALAPPIVTASTFRQDGVGRPRAGYEYSRTANPTRDRLERAVAALEGGRFGIAFASGSAATATVVELAAPGEEVVAVDDVYGGTYRFLTAVAGRRGITTRFVDLTGDVATALGAALGPRTRLVWLETPTNPRLRIVDIAAVAAALRQRRGAAGDRPLLVVDNTFASPALQRPLELGADLVVHSSTKYLAGHSDVVGGIAVTNEPALAERLRFLQNAIGAVPGPLDCYLVLRGLRTLAVRMERHVANALAVARFLAGRPDVAAVAYPGLAEGPHAHPGAAIAARQMRAPGGMVAFVPADGGRYGRPAAERARRICEGTRIFALAESLGGVESLIELPAAMTHASVAGGPLAVDPALVRLSVGIEAASDLVADLAQALHAA
ncbi:MAG TPA: PLP-dependent transferase [Candidatus Binatia bacterium]|nr:PLP-dependent transferase [Candidatus Binatia bacterium]